MKTKFLFLIVLSFFFDFANARTPRVSQKTFSYETMKLPQLALPKETSYYVNLISAGDYRNRAFYYENNIQIPGWTKTQNGAYEINITYFPINYHEPKIANRCELIKDTADVVIDTIRFFKNIYCATATGNIEIIDEKNNIVFTENLAPFYLEVGGKECRSLYEANRQYNFEVQQMQQNFIDVFLQNLTAQSNKNLNSLLGFFPTRKNDELMIVRNKNHQEYHNMQKFWRTFQNKTDIITANTNLSDIENEIKDELLYLKNIDLNFIGNNKADKKMRYIAYCNLATIYRMLEMPDKEIYYAQKIRSNDFKKFNAQYIIADAQRMKKIQEIHGIKN